MIKTGDIVPCFLPRLKGSSDPGHYSRLVLVVATEEAENHKAAWVMRVSRRSDKTKGSHEVVFYRGGKGIDGQNCGLVFRTDRIDLIPLTEEFFPEESPPYRIESADVWREIEGGVLMAFKSGRMRKKYGLQSRPDGARLQFGDDSHAEFSEKLPFFFRYVEDVWPSISGEVDDYDRAEAQVAKMVLMAWKDAVFSGEAFAGAGITPIKGYEIEPQPVAQAPEYKKRKKRVKGKAARVADRRISEENARIRENAEKAGLMPDVSPA